MARPALVLDASVGVKWFSAKGESSLLQALSIRDGHVAGDLLVMAPELFYYEVINALVHKKEMPAQIVREAVTSLFDFQLDIDHAARDPMAGVVQLARQFNITVYDAAYVALARERKAPLVTANPRHQRSDMGCRVIRIEEWKPDRATPESNG